MTPLLIFSLALLTAVLVSCLAARTVLSVSVLFIAVGYVLAQPVFGVQGWPPSRGEVQQLATHALLAVLFTDGMRIGVRELREAWHLPGRALLLGLPLTLLALAVLAHFVAGLGWLDALLLGAVLTPTDPVFASALVEQEGVPKPLRRLLNVESGVNDGLALPIVILLIQMQTPEPLQPVRLLLEVASGGLIGLALPWLARWLRPRGLHLSRDTRPLYALAVGLIGIALARAVGANEFLAAFFAGVAFASFDPELRDAFQDLGKRLSEILKLGTLLVFGALLSHEAMASLPIMDYVFAALALLLARPLGLLPALLHSELNLAHRASVAWFGPKGFASLVYAVMMLHAGVPEAERLFHIAALVVTASIVLHSTTDVPMARWLERRERQRSSA